MPADGGIRFGQYVLLRRIARGGMAEVFLAQQRGLEGFDRRVAIKRILPHLTDSPDFVKMFLGEAKLAAQLTHPNIVHIYDFGKVDHDYFIAMEYVEGVHTGQVWKLGERETRMPPTMVARIGADAAAALNYAHQLLGSNGKPLGLVHRDVSPANIMVSQDGIVKLCDFGIAKAAALSDQRTNPGQVKGKYAYMSPEQTVAAPMDGRSDVFSLGIVLWELLTGKLIVGRGDAVEAMRAIRDGKLTPIEKAAPQTPAALAKAITWALEPKRERRATAADLAQALEAFIKASPELATPMQLAAWVRSRFPRDSASGAHPALVTPSGKSLHTQASQGTMAGTNATSGTKIGAVTPASELIAASRVHMEPDETAETVALLSSSDMASVSSEDIANATVLDELSRELARPTDRQAIANRTTDRQNIPNSAAMRAADEPTALAGGESMFIASETSGETMMRSGAWREPVASGPVVAPTRAQPALRKASVPPDKTMGVRKRRPRYLVPIVALGGLAVLSFVIALAARSCSSTPSKPVAATVTADARPRIVVVDTAPPVDAADAPPDVREPTIQTPEPTALLDVITKPEGGMIKIGDQMRKAPTQFALPAGNYTVIAELDGYAPERRVIELERGAHRVQDIAFMKRVGRPTPPQAQGRLNVRTNPYSDVYDGTRKLCQTPCETELPVGTYTLLFKNPNHATTTKTIKISASKPVKLSFDLP